MRTASRSEGRSDYGTREGDRGGTYALVTRTRVPSAILPSDELAEALALARIVVVRTGAFVRALRRIRLQGQNAVRSET